MSHILAAHLVINNNGLFGGIVQYLNYKEIGILGHLCKSLNDLMSLWKSYFELYKEFVYKQGGFEIDTAANLAHKTIIAIINKSAIDSSNEVRELFSETEISIRSIIASLIPLIPIDVDSYQKVFNCGRNNYLNINCQKTLLSLNIMMDAIMDYDNGLYIENEDIDNFPISGAMDIGFDFTIQPLYIILLNIIPKLAEELLSNGVVISIDEPYINVDMIHGCENGHVICHSDGMVYSNKSLIIPQGYPFAGELTMKGYYHTHIEDFSSKLFDAEDSMRDILIYFFDKYHNGILLSHTDFAPYYSIFNNIISNLPKKTNDIFSKKADVIEEALIEEALP